MKRVHFVLVSLGLVSCVAGTFWGLRSTSAPERGRPPETARKPSAPADSNEEASTDTLEEVQRLRAELRQKDAQLRVLAALPKGDEATPDKPSPAPALPIPDADPAANTADLLDERMLTAPNDPHRAREMEGALRDAVTPAVLGQSELTSMHCGSTLCKVTLSSENAATINQSMIAMSTRLPKLFGATAVLQLPNGQSAMYLARSGDELDVAPPNQDKL